MHSHFSTILNTAICKVGSICFFMPYFLFFIHLIKLCSLDNVAPVKLVCTLDLKSRSFSDYLKLLTIPTTEGLFQDLLQCLTVTKAEIHCAGSRDNVFIDNSLNRLLQAEGKWAQKQSEYKNTYFEMKCSESWDALNVTS